MKVLISGANGFVGKNLSACLQGSGHRLTAISRNPSGENQIGWEQVFNDQLLTDVFIHLAGKAHDLKNEGRAQEYFTVNTDLTIRLFNLFLQSGASDFIYLSSVKAVADSVTGVLDENFTPDPKTPYGKSKLKAEEYLLSQKLPENKRLFILRPCMIHGPKNKGNLNLLYRFAKMGIPYPLASFENKRSFLSISNLNFVIGKLISDRAVSSGVYNVADDEPMSTNTVITLFNEILGKRNRLWRISPILIKALAGLGDKIRLPLNSSKLQKLTESYVVSNKKIKQALTINQMPVSSTEGLKITIKSFVHDNNQ
jgi:nucleoside-diphosphate-sugar epimerase